MFTNSELIQFKLVILGLAENQAKNLTVGKKTIETFFYSNYWKEMFKVPLVSD